MDAGTRRSVDGGQGRASESRQACKGHAPVESDRCPPRPDRQGGLGPDLPLGARRGRRRRRLPRRFAMCGPDGVAMCDPDESAAGRLSLGAAPRRNHGRICARRCGPIPFTASRSSTLSGIPTESTQARSRDAVTGPIPGIRCRSSARAVSRETITGPSSGSSRARLAEVAASPGSPGARRPKGLSRGSSRSQAGSRSSSHVAITAATNRPVHGRNLLSTTGWGGRETRSVGERPAQHPAPLS